jgi:hypothetical protein
MRGGMIWFAKIVNEKGRVVLQTTIAVNRTTAVQRL